MKKIVSKCLKGVLVVMTLFGFTLLSYSESYADGYGVTVSPMNQKIIINPGEAFESSFRISNPVSQTEDVYYELSIEPFYADDKGASVFETEGDRNKIVDWVSLEVPKEGVLSPNDVQEIKFKIDVPKDAAAGGQYFSVIVTGMSKSEKEGEETESQTSETSATIKEIKRIAHLVYAEVTGSVVKKGEVLNASVPGFMFDGNITGSSTVKNDGNVHGTATYKMQVFPLFSSEEIFTNEEDPETHTVLPGKTYYNETVWDQTPALGIFKVIYSVEFSGSDAKVEKIVIKCPIWLLFVIVFAVIAIIVFFAVKVKGRKKAEA